MAGPPYHFLKFLMKSYEFKTMNNTVYKLFDINGRRVLSTTITGDILDISSINSGFYMVEITINGYTNISKLIIQ